MVNAPLCNSLCLFLSFYAIPTSLQFFVEFFIISSLIMELGDFLSALISGTVRRGSSKRGPNVEALSGGCLRLVFLAKGRFCANSPYVVMGRHFCFPRKVDYGIRSRFLCYKLLLGRWCDVSFT